MDDDSAILGMMSQGLERKGFEVLAASSVTEGSIVVDPVNGSVKIDLCDPDANP
jgi:DNA-binding response OmpR family regulator